jgi:Transglycosylase SLT domain
MKTTAIAAVGAAMLGVFFCQSASAKRDDFSIDKWRITNFYQGQKLKARKPVWQARKDQKKPVPASKPVLADAAAKDTQLTLSKSSLGKLAAKQPVKTKLAAAKNKPASQALGSVQIANADGLPPWVRADRQRFEQGKTTEIAAMIASMAPCQKVPVWLALRVAMTESSLNPNVRGSAGEIGLFQLKCSTARYLGFGEPCKALYDARTNAYWGLKHLSLALQFSEGDARYAASKHNGGLGTTQLHREYVKQVMCSSADSGFPSAYQLGASSDVTRMCGKYRSRLNTFAGFIDDQDLQTASIAAIGSRTISPMREASLDQASDGCRIEDLGQPAVAMAPIGAKLQLIAAKAVDFARPFIVGARQATPQQTPARAVNFVRPSFIATLAKAKLLDFTGSPVVTAKTGGTAQQITIRSFDLSGQVVPAIKDNAGSQPVPVKPSDSSGSAILAVQADAKPQQTPAKQPEKSQTVTFVGSPSTPTSP